MTKKDKPPSQDELDAFYEALKGVKPLKTTNRVPLKKKSQLPSSSSASKQRALILTDSQDHPVVAGDEFIEYKHESISYKILRKLRKGQYNVEAELDLHGLTVEEARVAVETFLYQCLHEKMRIVVIIHGKGKHSNLPILKNKLNHWLRGIDSVLAFCSTAAPHGSRGAMYIMLKRNAT